MGPCQKRRGANIAVRVITKFERDCSHENVGEQESETYGQLQQGGNKIIQKYVGKQE